MHELGSEWWRDHKWNRIENWVGSARSLFCSLKTRLESSSIIVQFGFLLQKYTWWKWNREEWVGGYWVMHNNSNKRRLDEWTSLLLFVACKTSLSLPQLHPLVPSSLLHYRQLFNSFLAMETRDEWSFHKKGTGRMSQNDTKRRMM